MPSKKTWLDKGVEKITKNHAYDGKLILKNMLPQKMSAVLLDFAAPLLDSIDSTNRLALQSTIKIAIAIWNYSILMDETPPAKFADRLNKKTMQAMMTRAFSDQIGKGVLATLLDRKQSLYSDNKHAIIDFDIAWDAAGSEYHLTVMATD